MTEISFLLDLIVTEKLPKSVKTKILARVKEIEEARPTINVPQFAVPMAGWNSQNAQTAPSRVINGAVQSPSTAAKMAAHAAGATSDPNAAQIPQPEIPPAPLAPAPLAPAQIAQTPAAAQALIDRNASVIQGISGKPAPGRTSPRKW